MWLEVLAGPELSWLWALLISPMIVQGSLYINNPIHCLLAPHTGQRVVVGFDGSALSSVTLYGTARSYGKHKPMFKVSKSSLMPLPSISTSQSSKIVATSLFLSPSSSSISLHWVLLPSTKLLRVATPASRSSTGNSGTVMTPSSPISTSVRPSLDQRL